MKITLKKAPIEVPFPPNPSVVVPVRRLNAMESFGLQQKIRESTVKEPEIHPITGEPIFDKVGNVVHRREQLSPVEIVKILQEIVLDVRGLEVDGVAFVYKGDPSVLLEDAFAYQTEVTVTEAATLEPKKVTVWTTFWSELLDVARGNKTSVAEKVTEEEAGKVSPTQ